MSAKCLEDTGLPLVNRAGSLADKLDGKQQRVRMG